MYIRVLGSAAGGGVPQWNCRCEVCSLARSSPARVHPRLHASLAVSAAGDRWVVCNAGPDVQQQINHFSPLLPAATVRGTGISTILLNGADLDEVLGLLLLREGAPLRVYGTSRVRDALSGTFGLLEVMRAYSGIDWQSFQLDADVALLGADGAATGLRCIPFSVAGGPPPYAGRRSEGTPEDTVGLLLTEESTGKRLAYVPSCGAITTELVAILQSADCVFFDGTLWHDEEISAIGVTGRTGRAMKHLPLAGPNGTLEQLRALRNRRFLTHINNTNPILVEQSPERSMVEAAGWQVADDGLELEL
jgi:pyrroloquinoline quinone biosynthesis protein B